MSLTKLDEWWEGRFAVRRYDRGPMYICMMIAVMLTAISIIILGPVPESSISELSSDLQKTLSTILLIGGVTCTIGSLLGSRFFFPGFSVVRSYGIGLIGIPLVASSMFFYGYAVMINTNNFASALGGTFAPLLGIGAAMNGVYFLLEIRRIQRNMEAIQAAEDAR